MPWNETFYPPAMKHLPAHIRVKAIEIANALLDQGHEEGKAIRIGLAKAREWANQQRWGEQNERELTGEQ